MKAKEKAKKIWKIVTHNFAFVAIASLLWLLYRSGTKPTRITYPCQKAAAFNVGTALYVLPLIHYKRFDHFVKHKFNFKTALKYCFIILVLFGLFVGANYLFDDYKAQKEFREYKLAYTGPIEKRLNFSSHIDPHRVVIVHNSEASDGLGKDNVNLDQNIVKEMVNEGVKMLTGESTTLAAWTQIIPDPTKKVAIKINTQIKGIYTKSKVVQGIVDGLVERGVPEDNIIIYDKTMNAFGYGGFVKNLGPGVKVGNLDAGDFGGFSEDSSKYYIANFLLDPTSEYYAEYIINVPVLKALDGWTGVTLSMKNHYGTVMPMHDDIMNSVVKANALPEIRDRTRLIVVDAIFGQYLWQSGRTQHYTDIVNKIMVGYDTVAIDWKGWQMIEEMRASHGEGSATPYPEFIEIAAGEPYSLGTNNPAEMDIIELDMDSATCSNCLELSCNSYADCTPGTGTCASGYCCTGTCTDLPPNLADQTIVEGNDVNIVIEGTNCDGKDATLTYYEVDVAGNDLFDGTPYGLPASLAFSAGEARFSWTAQWFDDTDGDVDNNPEIVFDAICEGDSYTSDVLEITPAS